MLGLVWLVLGYSVLLRGRVLPWDAINEFYPTVYFNVHALRTGQWPWWNPYIYGGYAQIGDPQGMLFSPLLMAWMIVPAHPGAGWFSWGVLLHVLMGGTAMLALMRRHGANAWGSLVSAIVFMGGGVAASRLEHVPIVIAYAYAPVVLLAWRHFLAKPAPFRGILFGAAAGAMVAQLTQVTYLFVLIIVAYAGISLLRAWPRQDAAGRRRIVAGVALGACIASLLGGPQLVFSWAAMSLSNRNAMLLSDAAAASLDRRAWLYLLCPNAFGGLSDFNHAAIDPVQAFLYIGAIPSILLWGLVRAWHKGINRRTLVCFGMLAVCAAIYLSGTHTPVYGWLFRWLPGLSHFRRPSDGAYLLNFALAALAGIGASYIDLRSRRDITVLLVVASVWLVISASTMLPSKPLTLIAPGLALAALWRLRTPGSTWRTMVWLVAVLSADYRMFNFSGLFLASTDEAARYVASPEVHDLRQALKTGTDAPPARIATWGTGAIWDDGGMLAGVASTQGYNPLRYALYETWYGPRENTLVELPASTYNALPQARLDDLLGVRYLVLGRDRPGAQAMVPPDYRLEKTYKYVELWRNDAAYPHELHPRRVRLAGVGHMPPPDEFIATDFAETAWLTPRDATDAASGASEAARCHGAVRSSWVHGGYTEQTYLTASDADGWLVVSELDYPGWVAQVDGTSLPVHRANGIFRAVCVPAGRHEVSFRFYPWRMVAYAWTQGR